MGPKQGKLDHCWVMDHGLALLNDLETCAVLWIRDFFILSSYTLIRVSRFFFHSFNHFSTVGLLGRVTGPSQGRYLNTGQHKHKKTHTHTKHPCPGWDSNPRSRLPNKDSACYRPLGYRDRPNSEITPMKWNDICYTTALFVTPMRVG
jgi:hypothetical protein